MFPLLQLLQVLCLLFQKIEVKIALNDSSVVFPYVFNRFWMPFNESLHALLGSVCLWMCHLQHQHFLLNYEICQDTDTHNPRFLTKMRVYPQELGGWVLYLHYVHQKNVWEISSSLCVSKPFVHKMFKLCMYEAMGTSAALLSWIVISSSHCRWGPNCHFPDRIQMIGRVQKVVSSESQGFLYHLIPLVYYYIINIDNKA